LCIWFSQDAKDKNAAEQNRLQRESDFQCVDKETSNTTQALDNNSSVQSKVHQYSKQREIRIKTFLQHLDMKYDTYLEDLLKNTQTSFLVSWWMIIHRFFFFFYLIRFLLVILDVQ